MVFKHLIESQQFTQEILSNPQMFRDRIASEIKAMIEKNNPKEKIEKTVTKSTQRTAKTSKKEEIKKEE